MLARESPCRALWLAVLLQVKDDIQTAVFNSADYTQAHAFLTAGGGWAAAREDIAVCLDMDPEVIGRYGRQWIAARRRDEGLAPEPLLAPRPPGAVPQPRRLSAIAVSVAKPTLRRGPKPKLAPPGARPLGPPRRGDWLGQYNPFDPFARGRAGQGG